MSQLPIKIVLSGRQYGPRHEVMGFKKIEFAFWQSVFRHLPQRDSSGLFRIGYYVEISGEFDREVITTGVGECYSLRSDDFGVDLNIGPENHLFSKSEYMVKWVEMLKEGTRKIMATYADRLASLDLDLEELIALYDPALEEVLRTLD
ncbi:hypothetical protein CCB80_14810 [Armatimonadetes bacterium Uphvl-Ar1]|nr:hypothetical protein CCB80_14810 [Armatimonadetes bacterium Uphvl-Ar1]